MAKQEYHIGDKFGMLTILSEVDRVNGRRMFLCQCECGNQKVVSGEKMARRVSATKSCGCWHKYLLEHGSHITHGHTHNPLYSCWNGMMQRCYNPRLTGYKDYGGRGITVCERWHDIANFIADMGVRPAGMSIDRIDNSQGYHPSNCRWATPSQQTRNTRQNHLIEVDGKVKCFTDQAHERGVGVMTAHCRIKRGWSTDEAFNTPVCSETLCARYRNRKNANKLTFNGETHCMTEWAERLGMKMCTLHRRIVKSKWSAERALTTPVTPAKRILDAEFARRNAR